MLSRRAAGALLGLCLLLLTLGLAFSGPRHGRPAPARRHPAGGSVEPLQLHWSRALPPPQPAWPDQPKLRFDTANGIAATATTVLVASSRTDCVTAYDAATGEEKWHFFADGPVRFAPTVWEDRVYFVSDDGHLYCLDGQRGSLLWKFRGGPSERKILGNDRLISTWPARGAPVVADGTVYFAAGIWPFMGIFLHALDARTGAVVWTNDGDGSIYIKQPHQADSFGGVAPQGRLVVEGDRLLVPGGRSVPACYDRRTGKLLHFRLADNSKIGGGPTVLPAGLAFVNGGAAFDLANGDHLGLIGEPALVADGLLYACSPTLCQALELKGARIERKQTVDRKGKKVRKATWIVPRVGSVPALHIEAMAHADGQLYLGMAGKVVAYDLPLEGERSRPSWRAALDGRPGQMVAAGGRLFVSTCEGRLYCFAPGKVEPKHHPLPARREQLGGSASREDWAGKARQILDRTGVRNGWCIAWGVGSGRLIAELVRQSELRIVVVEPNPYKVEAARAEWSAAGLHGGRVAMLADDPGQVQLPPYLASLMVSEDLEAAGAELSPRFLGRLFASLRPYGGVACLPVSARQRPALARHVADTRLANAKLREAGPWMLLSREGALPGAADWTHEHADAANTRVSRDRLVKAPLGLLWFGGTTHDGLLPRHGHGPQPQVLGGRLFFEGPDLLRAVDIYTGRLLWEAKLPGVGRAYDTLPHQPGANASGSNFVSTPDGIYIACGKACVRLDPATGRRMAEFRLPPLPGDSSPPTWSYVNVSGDCLIAGANALRDDARGRPVAVSASQQLVVLDRHTGKVRWSATALHGFRHNGVCIGGGRLYALDRPSYDQLNRLQRRGEKSKAEPRLIAFDLKTGRDVWSSSADVFGTWLSYSEPRDILVEAGRVARDTLIDEPKGMRAWRGSDGKVLWRRRDHVGPAMIHGDIILKEKSACDLRTGAPVKRTDPLTGQPVDWTWLRTYGCNTPLASEHLLTFRSGAAGYFDLCGDGGTGNLGGFRSGCTNNLIVADGVLSVPDYTRNCTCSYQNQASLALVPMADAEMWTYFGPQEVRGVVKRVGINLGAPGNRKADDGTLWLEYPPVGGPSPKLAVRVEPARPEWFRRHSSQISGDGLPWVASSGAKGLRSLTVPLAKDAKQERAYTVRLHFAEPDRLPPGQRVFDVAVQGRTVLKDLDISKEAGGPGRALVKEVRGVRVKKELTVTLRPAASCPKAVPVLCGVEIVAEE